MFSGQINSLVTLNKLNDYSKRHWPTLAHFIGVPAVVLDVKIDDDGSRHFYVMFEPVSSKPEDVGEDWYLDEDEIKRIVLGVGKPATFRANPSDMGLPVTITAIMQKSDDPTVYYSFIGSGGEEFHEMPEHFLRPAYNFLILDGGEDGEQKDSNSSGS